MLKSNAAKRTFTIGFFSDLLNASQRSTPLLGRDMLYNMQLAVPSAISSSKFGISPYGEEILANMQWGFSYRDEANSILTAGAADFGLLGDLAYPLILSLMLRPALESIRVFSAYKPRCHRRLGLYLPIFGSGGCSRWLLPPAAEHSPGFGRLLYIGSAARLSPAL